MAVSEVRQGVSGIGATNIGAGLVCGLMVLVMSIGNANLLFGGPLRPYVSIAIGICVFGAVALTLVNAWTSSLGRAVASPQSTSIVALAVTIQGAAAEMAGAPPAAILATVLAGVALSTLLVALVLFLIGRFHLGNLVRFAPFPVVGGFLAGTGWLVLLGGLGIVIGSTPSLGNLGIFFQPDQLAKVGAAAGIILLLLALQYRAGGSLVLPGVILGAMLLFNLAALVLGIETEALRAHGWLAPIANGRLWPPAPWPDFAAIDWTVLGHIMIGAPVMVAITVLTLLLNMSAMEVDWRTDIDLDHELRASGMANVASALGGGPPGHHSLVLTLLAGRLGGDGAVVGILAGLVCLAALVLGGAVVNAVPTPVLGALMMWFGGSLVADWLLKTARRVSLLEYLTILLIFGVIVFAGFAWGVTVGILAAAMLFAAQYSQIDSVRHMLSGRDYQSSFEQSEMRREALRAHGDAILVIRLHGFLFFGTADRLRRRIQAQVSRVPVRYLFIDFQRVSGIDSSTVLSFVRLAQLAEREGFVIFLTGLSESVRDTLRRGGLTHGAATPVRLAANLDAVLEECESALLAEVASDALPGDPHDISERLTAFVPVPELVPELVACFERVEVPAGGRLVEEGAESDDIYVIESGRASVTIAGGGGRQIRLAGVGPGALVGEISFYLGKPRTASIVADTAVIAWRVTRERLAALEARLPEMAIHFHRSLAAMLADRLAATNRLVRFLED